MRGDDADTARHKEPCDGAYGQIATRNWYSSGMTTVEIVLRYTAPPAEAVAFALAKTREVYGIRRLCFDRAAQTLRVEYDATRLNAAAVMQLVRQAGLQVVEDEQVALPLTVPEPAPAV